MRTLILILFLVHTPLFSQHTQYVNPFVGTDGHGHTFPGATMPFAMVQLSPDTRIDGSWDGCSGYHYSDSILYGFSHTHLSGTGCSDYGDIAFMPSWMKNKPQGIEKSGKFSQTFSKKSEKASPGYYSVELDNGVQVELTSTLRVGLQKYSYSEEGYSYICLDLQHRDELLAGKISEIDKQTFSGLRRSKAWAEDQLLYYYFRVSKPAESVKIVTDSTGDIRLYLGFNVQKGESILIKTALSSVDEDGAKKNLESELNHWNFEKVKLSADSCWNSELSKIQTFGGTDTVKMNFNTALYHCMIHPNIMNDVDGKYRGRDKQVHIAEGFNYYTVFSLWDTYRALHPLLNLIDKKRSHDFMMTFKAQFEQSGRLPMWELWGNETNCMIGFHSVSVIWNAYINEVITREELEDLWPAVEAEAKSNRFGLDIFRKKGYLAVEDESESVSKTLEYSFNMHCVDEIMRTLEKPSSLFNDIHPGKLRYAWVNLFNPENQFFTPISNGNWIHNFDPYQINNHYTEANAWQYRFAAQSHFDCYTNDFRLSQLFNAGSKTTGRDQADITGLIGQYAHGNEPSHHVTYLFDKHDSISKYVGQICRDFYKPTSDGLCGNEDCGQMSAWYVFSAMGIYPVDPSRASYRIGEILLDSVIIDSRYHLINTSHYQARKYGYRRVNTHETGLYDTLVEIPYKIVEDNSGFITGSLRFGFGKATRIDASSQVFDDEIELVFIMDSFWFNNLNYELSKTSLYTTDINLPMNRWLVIRDGQKVTITETTDLWVKNGDFYTHAQFFKRPNQYGIQLNCTYNKQYTAGGPAGIMDGLQGDIDWRKGRWQGYQSQDFEAVIDLKKRKKVKSIDLGFLRDKRSWIFLPTGIEFYGSNDSINFVKISEWKVDGEDTGTALERVTFTLNGAKKKYRYLKVRAKNYGKLPDRHPGRGGDAFIFIDEIEIKLKK